MEYIKNMKVIVAILVLVILLGMFLLFRNQQFSTPSINPSNPPTNQQTGKMQFVFENPQKSAHYESNTPAHASVLVGVPINVVIDFNFDLAKPSEIKILKDGKDSGVGETLIDDSKLAMRRNMAVNSPDGLYKVEYKACWPDGSCHDGNFQFAIDRSLSGGFSDMTGKKEVEIKLSQIMFDPQNIKVSRGTKVTWVNDDSVEHYVNTDSHPAHTYYTGQNSEGLAQGDSYSIVFDKAGIYPYHCSVHADNMVGNILVE